MILKHKLAVAGIAVFLAGGSALHAQTERAVERRADRAERRVERRVERADYFNAEAWRELSPWTAGNAATAQNDLRRADRAMDNAELAAQRARNLERTSDQIDNNRGGRDVDLGTPTRTFTRSTPTNWYGYRDQNSDANSRWFYDYYELVPTYSKTSVRLADIEDINELADASDDMNERVTAAGEVNAVKKIKVGDKDNMLVKLSTKQQGVEIIDLGPISQMTQFKVGPGDLIKATGWVEEIGDNDVLIARQVEIDGQQHNIRRNLVRTLNGVVEEVKEVTVESGRHYIAAVDVNGQRSLVDLGPVTSYKVKVEPQSKIVVRGMPVRTNGNVVYLAREVDFGRERILIEN